MLARSLLNCQRWGPVFVTLDTMQALRSQVCACACASDLELPHRLYAHVHVTRGIGPTSVHRRGLGIVPVDADTSSKHVTCLHATVVTKDDACHGGIVRFSFAGVHHACPSADAHNRDVSPGIVMHTYIVVADSDVHENASPACITTQLRGCTSIQTPRELYLTTHMVYIY